MFCELILGICLITNSEAQQTNNEQYDNFIGAVGSFTQSIIDMFVPELPIIKEIENCGKRYRRNPRKPNPDYMDENHPDRKNYAECFWNCEWQENPKYNYKNTTYQEINYTTIKEYLPDKYIDYLEETLTDPEPYIDGLVVGNVRTLPMVPKDVNCIKDCYPRGQNAKTRSDDRFEICRFSLLENFQKNIYADVTNGEKILKLIKSFYECMILLNSQPSNLCKNKEISNCNLPTRLSFAKDYFETATEICYSIIFEGKEIYLDNDTRISNENACLNLMICVIQPDAIGCNEDNPLPEENDDYNDICPNPNDKCPNPDYNYNYRNWENEKNTSNILTWQDCQKLCDKEGESCQYWTWHKETAFQYAFQCVTMSNGTRYHDNKCISGMKACYDSGNTRSVKKKHHQKSKKTKRGEKGKKGKRGNKRNKQRKPNLNEQSTISLNDKLISAFLQTSGDKINIRLSGATIFPVDRSDEVNSRHHPWACSLRTNGFRGRHRCGVTLLSGPTQSSPNDPFVLVSAAHCNYICKDRLSGDVLETCCCRPSANPSSCLKKSPFCTGIPVFALAETHDVSIVCGEFNTGIELLDFSKEEERVFQVKKIINHPNYEPNRDGVGEGGPIEGNDIAVYHVESDYKLGDSRDKNCDPDDEGTCDPIWPVCLPREEEEFESKRGMVAGWLDTPPISLTRSNFFGGAVSGEDVIRLGTIPRVMGLEITECKDPQRQIDRGVRTYYPQGTKCYIDPSRASCADFGSSGSGVVREWKEYDSVDSVDYPFPCNKKSKHYQHSFVGPLSMSKGCDLAIPNLLNEDFDQDKYNPEFIYRGSNPVVATDATCFMPWIVQQYGLKLPGEFKMKESCLRGTGDKSDINKDICTTKRGTKCDFTKALLYSNRTIQRNITQCETFSLEGIAFNVNMCVDEEDVYTPCDNNCKGVDPNTIIAAGAAAAGIIGISGSAIAGPAAGLGLGGVAGVGGTMLMEAGRCGQLQCRNVRGRCVNLIPVGRNMFRCPRNRG